MRERISCGSNIKSNDFCREKNEANLVAALENKLPEDVDQLYSGALNHVFKTGDMARDIAVTVFSWILHMQEHLTPSAILDAIAAVDNTTTLQLPQFLSICANLVVLDTKCNVLRFADKSLHELFSAATSHSRLLSACIRACARGPIPDGNLQISPTTFMSTLQCIGQSNLDWLKIWPRTEISPRWSSHLSSTSLMTRQCPIRHGLVAFRSSFQTWRMAIR